jgi:ferredoxin
MGATVYARIQINEEHVLDVVKRANGIGFHMRVCMRITVCITCRDTLILNQSKLMP